MRLLVLLVLLVVVGPVAPAAAAEWRWPLDGPPSVSRPFAAPAHRYAAGHRGADLPASPGVPVRAAGDGVVSYAGLVAGRGVVAVVHGDLRTTYEPVSALVGVGDLVAAGEVLGTLDAGHLGCPVLACLHWGLRRGDDHLDPVRLVRRGPVRLLPLDGGAVAGGAGAVAAGAQAAAGWGPAAVGVSGDGRAAPAAAAAAAAAGQGPGRTPAPAHVPAPARMPAAARAGAPAAAPRPVTASDVGGVAAAALLGAAAVGSVRRRRR